MPQFSIDAARGQQIYEFKELTRISTRSWLAQQVVFTKTNLGAGTHTITVEVAPKSSWASDNYVAIDAFDVSM